MVNPFERTVYLHSMIIHELIEAGVSYTEAKEMELSEINLFLGTHYSITERRLKNAT